MNRPGRLAVLVVAALLSELCAPEARAQLPQIRITSVFPPGGQAGSTVDVRVTSGQDLDEIDRLVFDRPGITAVQKMQGSGKDRKPVTNTFAVSIDPKVPAGLYEIRAHGLYGLSNPRTFVVSHRKELLEAEPNNTIVHATAMELNAIANGSSKGGTDVDYYKFSGRKGQRVIVSVQATRIDSPMSAVIEIYNSNGRRIAHGRDRICRDPLADITLPADGEYLVKVYDFIYGSGVPYVYRLSVSTGPHIDFVMPPSGPAGKTGQFTLYGRNLPGGQPTGLSLNGRPLQKLNVSITLPADSSVLQPGENINVVGAGSDGIRYQLHSPAGVSNPVMIRFATAAVTVEKEPNDIGSAANRITLPAEVVGQFQKPGDIDIVTFQAQAGDEYDIEVFGQRDGMPVDPSFILEQVTRDKQGAETIRRITAQDDNKGLTAGVLSTGTDDPSYRFRVPANGTYRIAVRDRYFESRGSPAMVYRLSIHRPQSDFRLIAIPVKPGLLGTPATGKSWAIGLRKGDNAPVQIVAFRRDGFDGPINIWADGFPPGVTCKGGTIGPGSSSTTLILTAAENAAAWSGPIRILGKARVDTSESAHAVVVAKNSLKVATAALPALSKKVQVAATAAKKSKASKQAAANLKAAQQAQTAGQAKIAQAKQTLTKAEAARKATIHEIQRVARPATIGRNGDPTIPVLARVARSLDLSVMNEMAPFQVVTDLFRVRANQGRQILIPVKLLKRSGFDDKVTLTFAGLPKKANIQLAAKTINKGENSTLLAMSVTGNAKLGIYTLYLQAKGQVLYRPNQAPVPRAKAEQAKATQALAKAAAASKAARAAKVAAERKIGESTDALTLVQAKRNAARKRLGTAMGAAIRANQQAFAAKSQVTMAANASVQAARNAASKAAAAKQAKPPNKTLTAAASQAKKQADDAVAKVKKLAAAAKIAADKVTAAVAVRVKAAAAVAALDKEVLAATAVYQKAPSARNVAVNAFNASAVRVKAVRATKAAADKRLAAAKKAAAPKKMTWSPPSTPIIIDVKLAPASLTAAVPGGGKLKRGQKLDVKVSCKRLNGFAGPVTLSLPTTPGIKGLSAKPVVVPAGKTTGILSILAAADATEGPLANLVIRAAMNFDGQAAVDVPIAVKVSK